MQTKTNKKEKYEIEKIFLHTIHIILKFDFVNFSAYITHILHI